MIWEGDASPELHPEVQFCTETAPGRFITLLRELGRLFGARRVILYTSASGIPDTFQRTDKTLCVKVSRWRGQQYTSSLVLALPTLIPLRPTIRFGVSETNVGYLDVSRSWGQALGETRDQIDVATGVIAGLISAQKRLDLTEIQTLQARAAAAEDVARLQREEQARIAASQEAESLAKRNFRQLLERSISTASAERDRTVSSIAQTERSIAQYNEAISSYRSSLANLQVALPRLTAEVERITGRVDSKLKQAWEELNSLVGKGVVDEIEFNRNGMIYLTYKDIVMEVRYAGQEAQLRDVGTLKVGVPTNPNDGTFPISGGMLGGRNGVLRSHPHALNGHICFGSHQGEVEQMRARGEIMNIATFLRIFLETANTSDSLGIDAGSWPPHKELAIVEEEALTVAKVEAAAEVISANSTLSTTTFVGGTLGMATEVIPLNCRLIGEDEDDIEFDDEEQPF